MKLFHKIAVTTLGIVMATAVGAGVAHYNRGDIKAAKAADVNVTITADEANGTGGWTTTRGSQSFTKNNVTIQTSDGLVGTTSGKKEMRIYKGKTFTVSSSYAITAVSFTCTASGTAQYGPGCFDTIDGYSYSGATGSWSGIAGSIVLTASSNQVRISSIEVTYSTTAVALSVSPSSVVLPVNGDKVLEASTIGGGGSVSWVSSDESIVSVDSAEGISTTITGKGVGTATITASYSTAPDFIVNVEVFELSGAEGTQEDPYTVTDVYYIAKTLNVGANNGKVVYAIGKVTEVLSYDTANNRANFTITDNNKSVVAWSINGVTNNLIDSTYVGENCEVVVSGAIINHATSGPEIGYASGYQSSLVSSEKGALTTVVASLKTNVHAVGSVLEESDFSISLTYAKGVTGSIESGFTWTINGNAGNTPLIEGTNNIIVSFGNVESENIALVLTLIHAEDVELDVSEASILIGGYIQLNATITPAGYVDDVIWSSEHPAIANVSDSGLVTGYTAGTTNITVTVNGHSANCTITVCEPVRYSKITSLPEGVDLSGIYLIVSEDTSVAFDASLETLDANSNKKNVTITGNKTEVLNNFYVDIESVEGGYSIKTASNYYIGQTSDANGLLQSDSVEYVNTISFDETGNAVIASGGAYLRYNSATNSWRFRYFKSTTYTSQKAIQLYKVDMLQEWIDAKMHMDDPNYEGNGTGLCKSAGTYLEAKAALSALGKIYIAQFRDGVQSAYAPALARYQAWAAACGDTAPFDGTAIITTGSQNTIENINSISANITAIVVVTASIAAISLTGFFLVIRKRKHQ